MLESTYGAARRKNPSKWCVFLPLNATRFDMKKMNTASLPVERFCVDDDYVEVVSVTQLRKALRSLGSELPRLRFLRYRYVKGVKKNQNYIRVKGICDLVKIKERNADIITFEVRQPIEISEEDV
jgi:hypothetical protein